MIPDHRRIIWDLFVDYDRCRIFVVDVASLPEF